MGDTMKAKKRKTLENELAKDIHTPEDIYFARSQMRKAYRIDFGR